MPAESDAGGFDRLAMDQLAGDFTEEQFDMIPVRIRATSIDGDAAGRGDVAVADRGPGSVAQLSPGFRRADPVDGDGVVRLGGVVQDRGGGQKRVAGQISGGQDDVLGRVADIAEEAVAPVVEDVAGEDAPFPGDDAGRPRELVGERVPFVKSAVAVVVDQQANAADRGSSVLSTKTLSFFGSV